MCEGRLWQTSNLRRLRLGDEKKEEDRTNDRMKYNRLPYSTIHVMRHKSQRYIGPNYIARDNRMTLLIGLDMFPV